MPEDTHHCRSCGEPVCETSQPTGCTPPASIATGVKVYVVDSEGCVKLLTSPTQNSVLVFNAELGTLDWRDGSSTHPFCLPVLQERGLIGSACMYDILALNDNGCLSVLRPNPDFEGRMIATVTNEGICTALLTDFFPGGPGILYQAEVGSEFSYIPLPVDANTYLKWNGATFEWASINTLTGSTIPQYRDLSMTTNGSGTTVIVGSVGSVVYEKPDGSKIRKDNISISADAVASGAGGLDTGSVTNNTWYYVYGISNGVTNACMFSLSSSTPTMPAGYEYKILLGCLRYGTGQWNPFIQKDQQVSFIISTTTASFTQSDVAINTIDLSTIVSPNAQSYSAFIVANNANNNDAGKISIQILDKIAGGGAFILYSLSAAISTTKPSVMSGTMDNVPIIESRNAYLQFISGTGTPSHTITFAVTGYKVP